MKNNSFLSLALLAVIATDASASSLQNEVVQLPTYVVEGARLTAAEQSVNASLQSLRAQAATPATVAIVLPSLQAKADRDLTVANSKQFRPALRLAKS